MSRSRRFIWAKCTAGQAETIAISESMTYHATLLQIIGHFPGGPTPTDIFEVRKDSNQDPLLNCVIRRYDPGTEGVTDIICNEHFEFRYGDRVVVTFPNTLDGDVGVELVFKEGD